MRPSLHALSFSLVTFLLSHPAYAGPFFMGLGDLPGGDFRSSAIDVSDGGSVVAVTGRTALGAQAAQWTGAGGLDRLGALPGGVSSSAFGLSSDGSTIVGFSQNEAFRWTAADGMLGLGSLGGSTARGVSASGEVVVGATGQGPFRWTEAAGNLRFMSE